MDGLSDLIYARAPTASRPLLGLTVLIVEDSRFASEAVRLMCQRSGARIRRADNLENARRHLAVYRPTVVLVDVGLPDGSGLALIEALSNSTPRIEVILGVSGDSTVEADVLAAGADAFLEKPLSSLSAFQCAILGQLPADRQPPLPRLLQEEHLVPDPIALRDDLVQISAILSDPAQRERLAYVTQFLSGLARIANDNKLDHAVNTLEQSRMAGGNPDKAIAALSEIINARLASRSPI
ncbi:response regulator [Loktanella sp. Alg231-35]|uniref:response regulator n=1 Tax=Loktanella sp. Alg231-35 TaxID=1922220 RepID=UPI000D55B3AB|nr:response regulator [Loktanella sp. Alg231-35]